MVKNALVDGYTAAGKRLIELLDVEGLSITGALWFYDADLGDWSLLLASPAVDLDGARKVYRDVLKVLGRHQAELGPLQADDVSVKSPRDKPFSLLRGVVGTGARDIASIRFTQNRINDTLVEDAFIYRMT